MSGGLLKFNQLFKTSSSPSQLQLHQHQQSSQQSTPCTYKTKQSFTNTLSVFFFQYLQSNKMTATPTRLSANERALIQPRELPLNISPEMCTGKTYIVTGANVGLGLEASRHLVKAGAAKVIMTARNVEAGEAARADVESSTGIKGVAEVWHLDLSKFASVTAFAEKAKGLERIDAIIQNAAVAIPADSSLMEGHLATLTVNVISTSLLAILLLPKLTADAVKFGYTPSITFVSSGTCFDMGDYWKTIAEDPIVKMDNDENARMKA